MHHLQRIASRGSLLWQRKVQKRKPVKQTNEYRETSLAKSRVIVRKPKVPVTESNYKVLQFLDLLKDVDVYSEVTGKPLQERLYQYMSDASLSLSEMEPYFSYYPDKLYKNLVETRVIYNGILA